MRSIEWLDGDSVAGNGYYKIGLRYYDNTLGRWTQTDPAERAINPMQPAEAQPYNYSGCNPTNQTDPTGAASCVGESAGWGGLFGGLLGGGVGAAKGAALGSFAGPVGTVAGGLGGAVIGFYEGVAVGMAGGVLSGIAMCD